MRPRAAATLTARLGRGLVGADRSAVANLRDGVMRRAGAAWRGAPARWFVGRFVEVVALVGPEAALVPALESALVSA